MAKYRTSVRTPWSAQTAFEYLSDLEHFAEWDPGVKRSIQVAGDGTGLGAEYDVTVSSPGRDLTLRYKTVAIDPFRRIEVVAETSALRSVDVITVEDTIDGGCVVFYDADLVFKGAFAIANPLLGLAFRRIGDRAAAGLEQILEGVTA